MNYSTNTVKKSLATLVLSTLLALTSFSQTNKFSLSLNGLTTNFNYGKSNNTLQPYKKNFRGLEVGASYQAGISPKLSIVPELYFAMKGGVLKENNPITINKSTLKLYTVEMPLLARLHFNNLYLHAGPYVAYTLAGRLKTDGSQSLPESSKSISFRGSAANFKRWDFGTQVGAGYNFNMKRTILTLDARYGYGLTNISKDVERYNRMLNISLLVSKPTKKNRASRQG